MKVKRVLWVLLLLTVLFELTGPHTLLSQTEIQPEGTEAVSQPAAEHEPATTPIKTTKIGEAGKKIGKGIDRLSEKASSHLGSWINTKVFAGITWLKLSVCLLLVFSVLLAERIVGWMVNAQIRRFAPQEGAVSWKSLLLSALSRPLSLFIWAYGIYWAISPLFIHFRTPEGANLVELVSQKAANMAGAFAILWFIYRLIAIVDVQIKKWVASTESTIDDVLAPLVGKTLRVFIIVIGGIIIIQNLTGIKIGPLLASLGIGGLAVALAAREPIANFFGTLTILFDKPFQVGERIVVDNHDGVVESVGFRSSRIRTLNGHLVSIPNEKIVNSNVENIGQRPYIRWLTNITITYDTPPDKVEKAVQIIREILDNHEGMKEDFPPRVFFNGFNDWSLNILVIAWYHSPDYWAYQGWLQKTCLEIMHRFEAESIEFAFPTHTVYVANDDKRQLKLQMLEGKKVV
ncbi:MAG: mechanosensitive ion channel family protein [Desulfobacterales bacterium]|nr:MAG: mechanosensitive ion channel family protein [Desulfobacterales bacterium]